MKIQVITVGKVRQSFIQEGEEEYLKRMKGEHIVELIELGLDHPQSMSEDEIRRREAAEFLKSLKGNQTVILLDEDGKSLDSKGFAKFIEGKMMGGTSNLCFAVGGAFGWDDTVKKRADSILSLSPMTFTFQMTRLILVEQLYRAFSIIKGTPYHK